MSIENFPGTSIPMPEKPETQQASVLAATAQKFVRRAFSGNYNQNEYTLDRFEKHGGSCYTRTLAMLAIYDKWGLNSGVVVDRIGAYTVLEHDGDVWFPDCHTPEPRRPLHEAYTRHKDGATSLMAKYLRLPSKMKGNYAIYFTHEENDWYLEHSYDIYTCEEEFKKPDTHVIVDNARGKNMLKAIGDMQRWLLRKPDSYIGAYETNRAIIPDFIDLPSPKVFESVVYNHEQ